MHRLWVLLLLAGPVTAGSLRISMSYPEALEEAINLYNEVEEVKFLYRLLRAEPQPDWDPWAEGPQPLVFSVKETICPANQGFDFSTCDFKDDGDVKLCSGSYRYQKPQVSHTEVGCNW